MSNNKIPKELKERQEQQRQQTINLVLRAINDLNNEGHRISIKLLMEYTGLSRSVFAKRHIRDILIAKGIVKKAEESEVIVRQKTSEEVLKAKIKTQADTIKRLTEEKKTLERECELLRGKVFLLSQS